MSEHVRFVSWNIRAAGQTLVLFSASSEAP